MRGEDTVRSTPAIACHGSPPHARGRRLFGSVEVSYRGITPACAGKTPSGARPRSPATDHPRMRGEDDYSDQSKYLIEGSPPHARGRPERDHRPLGVVRITPACAGKTVRTASLSLDLSDHPRMRGEDALRRHNDMSNQGSPPHARGRRDGEKPDHRRRGITPACAGKTRPIRWPS